jgi:Tfp pilus assembly protein PilX
MTKTPMTKQNSMPRESADAGHVLDNQQGSVIVLVLLVLTIMTVLGIVSSDSVVTENFIVRNVGIHQQNVSILDSALMVGLQQFMQISDAVAGNFAANGGPNSAWFNDMHNTSPSTGDPEEFINTTWYENTFTRRCLDAANSRDANTLPLLASRGENANGNLRYAVVGFEPVDLGSMGGESLVVGSGANWRQGRIISEYVSADAGGNDNGNGMLRMEIGVKRMW